ncbi:MAG: stem cell self-renewal protein Piwi domain-containing protein [Candidatus Thiodiazotropha sp. (ex Lucinoma borealis)]|nr:stem cell self-renewal protein Piwi domain-containing protein [Candidatus Thiodiazotropha sp. (ex Lucinoma borealis)]MCU7863081.1 stem cell self-renewal protein Piwi domain-containing protein [Candidatus Thiodiazotropha sp. (ex Lucinoma borealis)]
MSVFLNAFPLKIPDAKLNVCVVPYDKDKLDTYRKKHQATHVFRRKGENIYIFSSDGQYPISGKIERISLQDNYGVFCFLVKDGLKRHLSSLGRHPLGFNPMELVSEKREDNLLANIVGEEYPLQIYVKYGIDTRIIRGTPCLVINCSTRKTISESCLYFLNKGFDLVDRNIVVEQEDGYRKLLGCVTGADGENLQVLVADGSIETIHSNKAYLVANRRNFDDYIVHTHGSRKDAINEKIRLTISIFNGGENKNNRIITLKKYFQSKGIDLIDGTHVDIEEPENVQNKCVQLDKPVFIFNDNGTANWAEKGFSQYGPYTKRTFDRNDPSICVICAQHDKGRVEQFVRKLLKGISGSKYFRNGLEGKFSIGTSRVEVFVTPNDDVSGYKGTIEEAIRKKSEEGGRWDLALVQVRESFKQLDVSDNPYYWGKSLFFLHQVPVQDFTIELLSQSDYSLGYSLNNMALACYAKMGGVPWLLKSSPTLSHELVVGIGSANIEHERGIDNQRIMGITTVFSGDGSYIVSNTSKAVVPEAYCDALASVLGDTIQKIQKRMNWQKGDTIRLIFHASVKKFNKEEIQAVRTVIDKYQDYQIEYAFLKISEDHGLHLFDSATANEKKGRLAPQRGKTLKLSKYEMLVYLIGQKELRQETDGHPRGVIVNIHKDSTFKDIKYLSAQLYSFASHSWRSYFPNPMPVTISYSDLIARNLGWLNQLPGWNDSVMIGKIGQSQWFL